MPALVRPRQSRWLKVISPFNKCFLFWPWPRGKLWVVMSPVATRSLLSPTRKVFSTHVLVPSNSCQARISRLRDQLERESSFGTSRFAGLHRTWTFELSKKSTFRFAFRNVVVGQDDVVAAAADGVPVREGLALRSRFPRLAGGHLHPDRHFSFPGRQHQRWSSAAIGSELSSFSLS